MSIGATFALIFYCGLLQRKPKWLFDVTYIYTVRNRGWVKLLLPHIPHTIGAFGSLLAKYHFSETVFPVLKFINPIELLVDRGPVLTKRKLINFFSGN